MSNHLGNVLVTVSDRKLQEQSVNDPLNISNWIADVVTANDYYPFGMSMPGRSYSNNNQYRYGFNGKENDNEVKGEGNQQDYGLRIYDTRIGKFLSVDPLTKDYPSWSPYPFAMNRPIDGIDLDGGEWQPYHSENGEINNYEWVGFNSDGSAPAGTVRSGTLNVNGTTVNFSSFYSPVSSNSDGTSGGPIQFGGISYKSDYAKPGSTSVGANVNIHIGTEGIGFGVYQENNGQWFNHENYGIVRGETANQGYTVDGLTSFVDAQVKGYMVRHSPGDAIEFSKVNVEDLLGVAQLAKSIGKGLIGNAAAKTSTSLVQANRTAGNLFRDELAAALRAEGRVVETEVFKRTPFGHRYMDLDVWYNGVNLGGIETKVGGSRYLTLQRLKDAWLGANGYPVQLVRKPANW